MNAHDLIEMLEGAGYEPRSYSGRGMSGKECVGVCPLDGDRVGYGLFSDLLEWNADNLDDIGELADLMRKVRSDSLGVGLILYWPKIRWPAADADKGDDWSNGI